MGEQNDDEKAPEPLNNPLREQLNKQKTVRKGSVPKPIVRLAQSERVKPSFERLKPRAKRISFERINSSREAGAHSEESYEPRFCGKKVRRGKDSTKNDAAAA